MNQKAAMRGCGVSLLGDLEKPFGHGPGKHVLISASNILTFC